MEAEEEKIVGHAKEAIHALADKKKNWKEKIGGFLWEILIIVIAVNLTIWFHGWNEKRHERKLEKEFLIGTKSDLEVIKNYLEKSLAEFEKPLLNYYDTVMTQIIEHRIDKVFIDANYGYLLSGNYFGYDNSRFESFKASGNLRLIENAELLKGITHLYTILTEQIEFDKVYFTGRREAYFNHILPKLNVNPLLSDVLNIPEVKSLIFYYRDAADENVRDKQRLVRMIEYVTNEIDKELKDSFDYEFKE